ncbi:MAG: dihydrolipoamide acetyltransferase family protein [Actinomycetota bacterium]
MPDFKLPDLGEGVTEAEIDHWLVKEGDTIGEDDPLVEVITDKATAEIPSPFAGVVARIHVDAGAIVPVGTVLVTIGETGETSPPGGATDEGPVPAESTPPSSSKIVNPQSSSGGVASSAPPSDVKATPPVRKLARELGVDLATVTGSGPEGRITRADVEAQAGAPAAATVSAGRREPLRGIRRTIAERMSHAHQVIPPVTHVEECDVTELDATRKLANERAPDGPRLTFLPFIVKAVVAALKEFPQLNTSLDEDAGEIVHHDRYDIGIAVDTPSGLMVPVVRAADTKRLREIATEIDRLADGARKGTLTVDDLRGSTFTVTSPGPFGGLMATPIIFYPQAAILGVHRATDRPVVRDGQIVIRKIMNLSITFDHRILDGLTAAKFCLEVVKLLEHPTVLALET